MKWPYLFIIHLFLVEVVCAMAISYGRNRNVPRSGSLEKEALPLAPDTGSGGYGQCSLRPYKFSLSGPGHDTTWHYTSIANITLPSLKAGEYRLLLFEMQGDRTFSSTPMNIRFQVMPAIWRSSWFRMVAGAFIIALLWLIFSLRERQLKRKYEDRASVEIEMFNLRMEALRSKINPHFTYNVLNSIQELVLKDNRINASEHIASFAHMNRMLLENAAHQSVPLHKEIKLIEAYLQLEKLRLGERLDYEIIIEPEMNDEVEVPPCIVMSFVENAIVHGIAPLQGNGKVRIIASMSNRQVKVIVEDNGVGRDGGNRNKAKNSSHHISMGIQLSLSQISILNQKRYNGHVDIIDLYDDDHLPLGTKVEIIYPV